MDEVRKFEIIKSEDKARTGVFQTAHGAFQTPAFMPVGTQATVKSVLPKDLKELGAEIILANTYHLHLRPGESLIKEHGGIHKFMAWDGPILTDSGGYQVFSLAKMRKISEEGVKFKSHIDGAEIMLTPEKVIQIQEDLGVDIMMLLDECVQYPAEKNEVESSLKLTTSWAKRSKKAKQNTKSLAFGIVQGGMYQDLRERAVNELVEIGFDSYAIGGLSVGEPTNLMREMTEVCCNILPKEKIRYLMGVGTPSDIVASVAMGVDLFDCVIPTRSARFGRLYTDGSWINIRNARFKNDHTPIQAGCNCYTCQNFSRSYIHHLFNVSEVLGIQLASIHNLHFYQSLLQTIRTAIKDGNFLQFANSYLKTREEFKK